MASSRTLAAWLIFALVGLLLTWFYYVPIPLSNVDPGVGHGDEAVAPSVPDKLWKGWDSVRDIFVFGDSHSTTFFHVDHWQPNEDAPFGNTDASPDSARRDTPKWIQYLRSNHTLVFNLAVSGARIAYNIYQGFPPESHETANAFRQQLESFHRSYAAPAPATANRTAWEPDTTLFALWFGINDVVNSVMKRRAMQLESVLAVYAASIERLYGAGARNFLILNVPPVERIMWTNDWCPEDLGEADPVRDIRQFNERVPLLVDEFRGWHADATVFLFDAYASWTRALDSPAAFAETAALKNVAGYCELYSQGGDDLDAMYAPECGGSVKEYFWLNSLHPTQTAHRFTAAVIAEDCFGPGGPRRYCS